MVISIAITTMGSLNLLGTEMTTVGRASIVMFLHLRRLHIIRLVHPSLLTDLRHLGTEGHLQNMTTVLADMNKAIIESTILNTDAMIGIHITIETAMTVSGINETPMEGTDTRKMIVIKTETTSATPTEIKKAAAAKTAETPETMEVLEQTMNNNVIVISRT
jgi:hypothetical protein